MVTVELVLVVLFLAVLVYRWSTQTHGHWKERGVAFVKPMPLFGNSFRSMLGLEAGVDVQLRTYKELSPFPFAGTFLMRTPVFLLHRPHLVEAVLVKDFTHFYNRGIKFDEKLDPFSSHLVNLEDQRWKNLRNKLTPVFTSGKLRLMEDKLIDCGSILLEYIKSSSNTGEALEAREVMSRFTTDVIGAVAFGLNMNAIKDPNSEFRKYGKEFFRPSLASTIRSSLSIAFPKILSLLGWKRVSNESQRFFISIIKETIKQREASAVEGTDFLQFLINIRKQDGHASNIVTSIDNQTENTAQSENDVIMDDKMLIANAFVFFNAGFETTASTLSYCLFLLASNQDIQEKLYREIKSTLEKHDNIPTYNALKEIHYLEQVINETLRMYPPVRSTIRECTKDYNVPDSNIVIKKGDLVQAPIYSLQHDPKYFPDPERFNPDRFSQENKKNIVKGSFLPFGDGPRICIGMRFALYEMKVALAKILMAFSITVNSKTQLPITFKKTAVFLVPNTGLWLNFKSRS